MQVLLGCGQADDKPEYSYLEKWDAVARYNWLHFEKLR